MKVYGDDGWIFIEEASDKLLIETILEAQQLAEEGEVGGKGRDDVGGSCEPSQSVPQLCNEQDCREEQCVEMVCKTKIDDEKCKGKKIQVESHLISKVMAFFHLWNYCARFLFGGVLAF